MPLADCNKINVKTILNYVFKETKSFGPEEDRKKLSCLSLSWFSYDFCLRIPSMSFCSPSHGKCGCGGRELLTPTSDTRTAGWTGPNCLAIGKGFRLLYIPSSRYIGKNWCPRFGAKIYAKTQKYVILTFKQFSTTHRSLYGPVTYKFVSINLHQPAKNIHSAPLSDLRILLLI